jgi:hypothetical protein
VRADFPSRQIARVNAGRPQVGHGTLVSKDWWCREFADPFKNIKGPVRLLAYECACFLGRNGKHAIILQFSHI